MLRKNSIIIFIIGILFITVIFYQLPKNDKTTLVYISLFGSFLSLFGLILAYYQILSLKQLSIKTEKAVTISNQRLQKVLSISELSKSKKLVEEIQHFLHSDNFSGALIRLTDLKETLIQTKYNESLEKFTLLKAYKTILTNTAIDINSINSSIIKKSCDKIDKALIINNLEITKSKLIEFENELKFKDHDIR
ncbi:MAG TPA: hypothetical protein VNW06_05185 [Cytophagaceae bacterium]|jgi:hypothetical protein|nr:hypothetical protein [Cytophagaceae bacterium]